MLINVCAQPNCAAQKAQFVLLCTVLFIGPTTDSVEVYTASHPYTVRTVRDGEAFAYEVVLLETKVFVRFAVWLSLYTAQLYNLLSSMVDQEAVAGGQVGSPEAPIRSVCGWLRERAVQAQNPLWKYYQQMAPSKDHQRSRRSLFGISPSALTWYDIHALPCFCRCIFSWRANMFLTR